ncbi:MAG: M48 family metalloprotease [Armatimonadota bacterium]
MRNHNHIRFALCAVALLTATLSWAQAKPKWSEEYEKKVGAEAAAEVEKKWKLMADPDKLKMLAEMIDSISAVCDRPEVKYTVKIVDTDEVNAFSLPGGLVYVTKGLLADAQSDSELAGVLAHEITHNTFYDALIRADKSQKLFMGSIGAALGALILGAKNQQVSAALAAGEYIRLGILSNFSLDVESRADAYALKYLIAGKKYDPVGMLTFMERLAAQERHKPKQELGVYADHPDTDLRCRALIDQLEEAGIDINRRAVTKWEPAKAEEKEVDGKKVAVVSLWGVELMKVQTGADGKAPLDRAKAMAETLTKCLADGLEPYQVAPELQTPQPQVLLGRTVMLTITPEDAQAAGVPAPELAKKLVTNLGAALHKEKLGRWW